VHTDDLRRFNQRQVTSVSEIGRTHEQHWDAGGSSLLRAVDDGRWRVVATHGVDRDGKHGRQSAST
jgi:hypothetical protein